MKSGSRLRRHRIIEGIFANALDDYGVMTAILLVFPGMLCALKLRMALRCEQTGYYKNSLCLEAPQAIGPAVSIGKTLPLRNGLRFAVPL
jgi:hypothetical protein